MPIVQGAFEWAVVSIQGLGVWAWDGTLVPLWSTLVKAVS
jgi:hypothetical protein